MNQSKILIIGANGQLGKALQTKYPTASAVDKDKLDITDWNQLFKFDWSAFDIIINAAAYTDVDGAETDAGKKLAWQINGIAAGYLSKIVAQKNLTLVQISSDYVFDGSNSLHSEGESFSPLGVYAQSKAAGDIAVGICKKHYILRTSWLIGDGPNFVRTMLDLAQKNVSPKVVNDQIGRLTFTPTLVAALDYLLNNEAAYGTYNISNSGEPTSWADITSIIFEILSKKNLSVEGISTKEYFENKNNIAPRPLQSTLDLGKIQALGFNASEWQEDLVKYIEMEIKQ